MLPSGDAAQRVYSLHIRSMRMTRCIVLLAAALYADGLCAQTVFKPEIPRAWDDAALAGWATPLAGINVRPTNISALEYYALPVDNRRTYPVYYPGQEPEGYWEMLQHARPQALIEPDKLKTRVDWVEAGRIIFAELDDLHLRTVDPKIVAAAGSRATFEAVDAQPLPDGTVYGLRWVPTERGVASPFKIAAAAIFVTCRTRHPSPGHLRLPGWRVTATPGTASRWSVPCTRSVMR
jgi:hypothetical protein